MGAGGVGQGVGGADADFEPPGHDVGEDCPVPWASSALAEVETVVTTVAPRAFAIWISKSPMPPALQWQGVTPARIRRVGDP